ncbi:hypothetical protein D3C80_1783390 [compost metagenome]
MDKLISKYSESGDYKMMGKAITIKYGVNAASQPKQIINGIENIIKEAITLPRMLTGQ